MAGLDRRGPLGEGSRTGRGLGLCKGDVVDQISQNESMLIERGRGLGRGFGAGRGQGGGRLGGRGRGMGGGMGLGRAGWEMADMRQGMLEKSRAMLAEKMARIDEALRKELASKERKSKESEAKE